jgi:hypothetical protein
MILCVWLLCAPALRAESTLRWKLTPGENLAVAVTQTTKSTVAYAGKSTATEIKLDMELLWRVLSAENGQIRLEQTVRRLSVSLDAPPAGKVLYDSAKSEKPAGAAREIAAELAPLLAAKVEITMNDLGEVLEAKTAGEAAAAGTPPTSSLLTKEAVQQLLKQPLVVLSKEAVSMDKPWVRENDLATSLGAAKQVTTYKYVGPVEEEGHKLEKIAVETRLQPMLQAMPKLLLKSHKQTGEVLFDAEAGRVFKATQDQTLVTERPYRETQIVVTLESKQQTTLTPAKVAATP